MEAIGFLVDNLKEIYAVTIDGKRIANPTKEQLKDFAEFLKVQNHRLIVFLEGSKPATKDE